MFLAGTTQMLLCLYRILLGCPLSPAVVVHRSHPLIASNSSRLLEAPPHQHDQMILKATIGLNHPAMPIQILFHLLTLSFCRVPFLTYYPRYPSSLSPKRRQPSTTSTAQMILTLMPSNASYLCTGFYPISFSISKNKNLVNRNNVLRLLALLCTRKTRKSRGGPDGVAGRYCSNQTIPSIFVCTLSRRTWTIVKMADS